MILRKTHTVGDIRIQEGAGTSSRQYIVDPPAFQHEIKKSRHVAYHTPDDGGLFVATWRYLFRVKRKP